MAEIYIDKGMTDYAIDTLKDGIRKFPSNEYFYIVFE